MDRYQAQTVGASIHPECNRNTVGRIEVIAEFRQPPEQ